MTTTSIFAVFADFNDPREEPALSPVEEAPLPADDVDVIHSAAWTEGFLAGRQEGGVSAIDQPQTARLLTLVDEMQCTTAQAVDAASLAVADLLVTAVIAMASDGWSSRLLDQVRLVADRIKPAMTVAPEFLLRDDSGAVQRFNDISDLSRALDAGGAGEDVTIRWHRGEATISRTALLEDLREAFTPLSAGRVNGQDARNQT